jgi:hypothetical protein
MRRHHFGFTAVVTKACRDLEQVAVDGCSVLADEVHVAIGVNGDDGDCPEVERHVTVKWLSIWSCHRPINHGEGESSKPFFIAEHGELLAAHGVTARWTLGR